MSVTHSKSIKEEHFPTKFLKRLYRRYSHKVSPYLIGFQKILRTGVVTKGKEKVSMTTKVSVFNVDTIASILASGGGIINEYGDLIIKLKKGFLSKRVEEYVVEFGIIRMISGVDVFFAVRTDKGVTPYLTALLKKVKGNKVIIEWHCHEDRFKDLCKETIKILKHGLRNFRPATSIERSAPEVVVRYRMSDAYSSRLDGFAEVTLANAVLEYPLAFTSEVKVEDVKNIETLLEDLGKRLGKGRYIVTLSGSRWRFIVGFDTEKRIFTPSFISWETNERLLGEEALKRFMKIPDDTFVRMLVFRVPERYS